MGVTLQDVERIARDAIAARIPGERVRRITAESYVTSRDEDGFRVRLVIADDDNLPRDGDTILDTLVEIGDRLLAAGDERLATLDIITEDELAHLGDPDV